MSKYLFPSVLILLDFGAAVVFAVGGDVKKAVYWIAAAVLISVLHFRRKNEKVQGENKTIFVWDCCASVSLYAQEV